MAFDSTNPSSSPNGMLIRPETSFVALLMDPLPKSSLHDPSLSDVSNARTLRHHALLAMTATPVPWSVSLATSVPLRNVSLPPATRTPGAARQEEETMRVPLQVVSSVVSPLLQLLRS